MTDRTSIDKCKKFFGLSDADEAKIAGDEGRAFLWELWKKHGDLMYENVLNVLRQEWWHAYEAPGRFDTPVGFWLVLPDNGKLLDYGCGTSEINRKHWIEKGRQTILIDKSATIASYLRYKYAEQVKAGTVEVHLIYDAQPEEFDALVCTDLFEHISRPLVLLRELWKTLKTGGQILTNFSMSYPHAGHLKESIDRQPYWWKFLTEHSRIVMEDGYIWAIKQT